VPIKAAVETAPAALRINCLRLILIGPHIVGKELCVQRAVSEKICVPVATLCKCHLKPVHQRT
jgi:hypothetical protein